MASGLMSGQREELGSGGKVIHSRRRLLPSFSPYKRPPSSSALMPLPIPEAHTGNSIGWLRGFISGFGKLFFSVLGSEDSSPSPSECSSNSDEYYDYSPNEHVDQLCSDDLTAYKMRENETKRNVESLAIFPKSESKLVIEQLLMQETFTRDECNKLIEMIQSRVRDKHYVEICKGTQNVVPVRIPDHGQALNLNRNVYGISNFSPKIVSSLSPRFYSQEAVFTNLRSKAVTEAKKWFEEKRLTPSPTYDRSYGPCILNTRMNQYGFEEDVGSPIEMAKSYMQSLPPWRSPSFSTNGRMMSPSCGNTSNFGSHLITTSEVKKLDYLTTGSLNSEENHRTILNSLDNEKEFSNLGQAKLLSRLSVHEAPTTQSAVAKTCSEVQDKCLKLLDGTAAGDDQPMETDNGIFVGAILQSKEVFKESQEGPKVVASNNIEQLHYDIVNMLHNDIDMSVLDVSQVNCVKNVEIPLPTKEQIGSISAHQDSLVFASIADQNNGDYFPETETLQLENITPGETSINKKSADQMRFQAVNSRQVDLDAALYTTHPVTGTLNFYNTHPVTDLELPNENPQTQDEAIGAGENFETSSNFAEINNMKSDFESTSKGDPTATSSSYGGAPAASVSEGTLEPASDVSIIIHKTRVNTNASKAQSGTNMKSFELMLTEPPEPNRGNKRKAKKVVRQKKWRG